MNTPRASPGPSDKVEPASDRVANGAASNAVKWSHWRTIKAVAWSFAGIRGRGAYEQDIKHLSPVHVIVAGLVGVFLFVGALAALVNWIVPG